MIRQEWTVGLMTGTVLDGNIDVALLRSDGETIAEFGPWTLAPYPSDLRPLLVETLAQAADWGFSGDEPEIFARAEARITEAQSEAVATFLEDVGLPRSEVAAVGFHGQTVLHRAPAPQRAGRTRQLGDGAAMARRLGITVVNDFRSADMAAGGQGAPLAGIYHAALLKRAEAGPETAVLNLGGVANITWVDASGVPHAFDTGPANAPLNDWIGRKGHGSMDRDGRLAAAGSVDEARLARLLEHPYLVAPYPKSLDRNDFTSAMADGLSDEDGAATLTAFTAGAVAKALDRLPARPQRLVLCGGGRHNPVMRKEIAARAEVEVLMSEDFGWRGDAVEAECFALLAARTLRALPISFPTTTGVARAQGGGVIHAATAHAQAKAGSP
ncbi:anhydro-N-acetylmuramic acid kinase [Stappia sp. WLB 29]|uniref:anhydro-N-acetylmuramic acid kinase n=1 Tax=Stappia sp. WLB 29 TaxID=2925220 RepID=UPI0020BE4CC6|nr:anhydro-N-acetylmuramic acid kinase [Stappia sp. WLB 29]